VAVVSPMASWRGASLAAVRIGRRFVPLRESAAAPSAVWPRLQPAWPVEPSVPQQRAAAQAPVWPRVLRISFAEC
jgi:hypothetical protein